MRRVASLVVATILFAGPSQAGQGSIVGPTSGPKTMTEVMTAINAGLLAIQSCNAGTTAPANGPSDAAVQFQCWADTSANPVLYKYFDGGAWVTFGALDTASHVWTPYRNGAPVVAVATSGSAADLTTGTLPAARLPVPTASTLGGIQSLTCSSNNWFNTLSTSGVLGCAQPSFSDLSGSLAAAQMPALSGDVSTTAGSTVTAIGAGKVTNAMLAGSIAASKLIGTDIATVGTVTAGTWQAGTVAIAYGGTGATSASAARTSLGVAIGSNVQAWDADLDCIAAISGNGVIARTGAGTCAVRTLTAPASGITVGNGDGVSGNPTLALANDLAALEGLSGTGLARRTGTDAWSVGTTVAVSEGGTGAGTASGTSLDNITGFSGTGFLTRTGAGAYAFQSASNGIVNGNLAQAGAATFKGNPTGSTASVSDFTIQGLTARGTPDAANDKLPIYDNAAGTIKYVTPAQIAGASSGTVTSVTCNGGTTVITTSGTCASREILTANRTYYVRTDGNDSNSGLANTSGGAFLTIHKALTVAAALDCVTFNVTIQVDDGTHTEAVVLPQMLGSGTFTLQGNVGTPANSIISATSAGAITGTDAGSWSVNGFRLQTTTSGSGLLAFGRTSIKFQAIDFGTVAGPHHMNAEGGGRIIASGGWSISGNSTFSHMTSSNGGYIEAYSKTITLSGTRAFSTFAFATNASINSGSLTFSGSATGTRYQATLNGVILTNGGGGSYFPGSLAGSVATGGQYM